MDDKELLELAAKAAGIRLAPHPWTHRGPEGSSLTDEGKFWNPLADDGDALRLVVKLGIRVRCDHRAGFSWVKRGVGSTPHDGDPYAATRRAIVRAAAEIGKDMP